MTVLRRTPPFLAHSRADDHSDSKILLIDQVELSLESSSEPRAVSLLSRPIDLGHRDRCIPADEAERLVEDQYQTCLEHLFGHPVWQRFRDHNAERALYTYLLETRHYLAAAPFRMASGITDGLRPAELWRLQSAHVVEEADHDRFFENGLAALGCPRDLVRAARPSPVTIEWIHLMRTVAAYSPLAAAIASGLLEYTAGDKAAVTGWHSMLADNGMLPHGTVDAIFEHVGVDLELGHGSNWRDALRAAGVVPAVELADWLNVVTLVAEMIVRWFDTFETGLSVETVEALPGLHSTGRPASLGGEIKGLPVWPAEIYDSYVHGPRAESPGTRQALALSYAFAGTVADGAETRSAPAAAQELTAHVARDWSGGKSCTDLEKLTAGWMTAIDGHKLWQALAEQPTYALVYGWMVENYHYVSGIWQHTGAAISTCPDPLIRAELVKHLDEESDHGRMFLNGIERARDGRYGQLGVASMRPLPTTVSFVGTLRELALRDWKAYIIALCYLQATLSTSGGDVDMRHQDFYAAMTSKLPAAKDLTAAMRRHDAVDTQLGHGDVTHEMLQMLTERHEITAESVASAALVAQLTWSFLDGIHDHYRHGDAAVIQRVGWHVRE